MEDNKQQNEMPLLEEVKMLRNYREENLTKKPIKIPRKAKVRKSKLKKGWIGIIKVDENGNLSGEKQKLEDSTIRLKEKTYHAVKGDEIGMWEGKYPVIIQKTWKKNPVTIKRIEEEKNETHGQKYIMARMIGDTIKVKAAAGGKAILYLVLAGAIGYGAYMLFTGQL